MRVILVPPRFAPEIGGVETHVAQLATALTTLGCEVIVATNAPRHLPRRETVPTAAGSYLICRAPRPRFFPAEIPSPKLATLVRSLVKDAQRSARPVVVHAHSYHALAALLATAASSTAPLVLTPHYHGTGHTPLRRVLHVLYRPLGRLMMHRADRVIAVTGAEATLISGDFDELLRAGVDVIPNGARRWPRTPREPHTTPTVLTVSRLEPYKHLDTLIHAALAQREHRFDLVIAGDGPDRARLESLAANSPRVRILGRVDDEHLATLWATASVYASASNHEAFGLGVAEALVSGIPVVVSDIPAHQELIALAGAGTALAGHDPEVWCRALTHATENTTPNPSAHSLDQPADLAPVSPTGLLTWDEVGTAVLELYRHTISHTHLDRHTIPRHSTSDTGPES
jgi:glycosyltransferase involved in cell wall biosynthesis